MMKAKKKSKFLTFCFSLLPGAGEMFMGFMNMGVSLMFIFFAAIALPVFFRMDELAIFAFIIWAYGFFHANHLASLSDEEFDQVEDSSMLNLHIFPEGNKLDGKQHKWVATVLIVAGILLLWNTFTDMAYHILPRFVYDWMRIVGNYAPRVLIALVIIYIGIKMISGRKEQLALQEIEQSAEQEQSNADITNREE